MIAQGERTRHKAVQADADLADAKSRATSCEQSAIPLAGGEDGAAAPVSDDASHA